MRLSRILSLFVIAAALAVGGYGIPVAHAQTPQPVMSGLETVGGTIALPDTDPRIIASRIINVVLGTLAIIFLIIIVYAGFLYMTSGGNPAKTETAKLWIRNGVIGLIIILSSWAIASYILQRLVDAATGGGGGGGGSGGGGGGGFTPGGSSNVMRVVSISPNGAIDNRKVVVKIVFALPLSEASASSPDAIIVERADGTRVDGTITRPAPNQLFFTPTASCPDPNADRFCFDENAEFNVRANDEVITGNGAQPLRCGGFYPSCEGTFQTGAQVDVSAPSVSISSPINGAAVPADALVDVVANASDNVAIGFVAFSVNGEAIGEDGPAMSVPSYSARVRWDTAGIPAGETRSIVATAYDTDTGRTESSPVSVLVRAAHCFNGTQDQGETGIDCGGDVNSTEYCGACGGGSCTTGADCASGVCTNGICVDQPIITSVVPNDGAVGSLVTVSGYNFGSTGEVLFLGLAGSTPVRAIPPPACVEAGVWTWGTRQVIVEVPAGAQTGPIRLTNANSGLSDDTNVPADGAIPDFVVNDTLRPGLCAVRPSGAAPSAPMTLYGTGFGNSSGLVQFGAQSLVPAAWADRTIEATYPNVPVGAYDVAVNAGGVISNPMTVEVYPAEGGGTPEITEIMPGAGPVGQYVTITGRNFGTAIGTVFFQETASGQTVPADTTFPAGCSQAFWHDTNIVVKVPPSFTAGGAPLPTGAYTVFVRTARPTAPESNRVDFLVNNDVATPGLCSISPRVGPIGTNVTLYGERFGASGSVVYNARVVGATTSWASGQIASRIPSGAQSGPVRVEVPVGGGATITSNSILLEVRNCNEAPNVCSADEACCPDGACYPPVCENGTCTPAVCSEGPTPGVFAWQFSTGIIPRAPRVVVQCGTDQFPSPTPWSGHGTGVEACINAQIGMLFTTRLEPTTVSNDTVQLFACTGSGASPCSSRTPVAVTIIGVEAADGTATEGRDYVRVQPSALNPSTTYEVVLTTGIRGLGEGGTYMDENAGQCGDGNAYCFQFRTRDDATPCAVASVLVAPDAFTATEASEEVPYSAVPRPSDICQIMPCEPYDWRWAASTARASITNARMDGRGSCYQTATALMETEPGSPVQIQATETASSQVGTGDLTISFRDPEVVAYGPDCDTACLNALVWATFNIPLDPVSVNAENIEIRPCTHENCRETGTPLAIPAANIRMQTVPGSTDGRLRQLVITPQSGLNNLLQPGRFYQVVLRGGPTGLRSPSGSLLTRLNSPLGFTWTFRTRTGEGAICVADRVDVSPGEKYETIVGARQLFTATPFTAPDACSTFGQAIYVTEGYAWASSRPNVAGFVPATLVDTGSDIPEGCRVNCTLLGADGVYQRTARCGNSRMETTDGDYIRRYLLSGGTRPTDEIVDGGSGGEECDGEAGCNSACLWDPVSAYGAGGTCGNGRVELVEDCDPGRVCAGTLPGSSTPPGSDCTADAAAAACVANGGTCAPVDARGCSSGCRNYGARAGGSTCGNGDVSDGEDCDDGNTAAGDGCSPDCLHEGSRSTLDALCGNGILEPGEACERAPSGVFPAGCDAATCLYTGTRACAANGNAAPCCGNGGAPEAGEECDDANGVSGDGCSARCLFEGSSPYHPTPSFCGDGVTGVDESPRCEQAGGDGRVDHAQLATIIGNAQPDADGLMSSELSATLMGVQGTATYGLRCGFTSEQSCTRVSAIEAYGLTDAGCCSLRPIIMNVYPSNLETNVCRNVLISGSFNVEMDEPSVGSNFIVARRVQGTACPAGEELVSIDGTAPAKGIKAFFVRVWHKILAFFGGQPAHAQVWCRGGVTGSMQVTKGTRLVNGVEVPNSSFAFTLDHALDPNTTYIVQFTGDTADAGLADNADLVNRHGMKSKSGVVMDRDYSLTFTTGQEICTLNSVTLSDETAEHPFLFLSANEAHPFVAHAQSIRGGRAFPISATAEYAWEWENWTVSNVNIATLNPSAAPVPANRLSTDIRSVISTSNSGSAYVTARAHITADTVQDPSTVGLIVPGAEKITSLICESPWPSRQAAPFTDAAASPSLDGTIFQNGPYYNFAMTYCRDAGAAGPNEDLPALMINAVPTNNTQRQQGILREYLFTFQAVGQERDAIGVRIMDNPQHYSIAEWYRTKGFSGRPTATTIDGYPALREGRTVYIGAVSTEGPGFPLYSNVYVLSYNDDATPVTRQIFDALLESLNFNANLTSGVSAACMNAGGSLVLNASREPVACSADWQCGAYGAYLSCDNFKAKLQRDLVRIGDFQSISTSLADAKSRDGKYPNLSAGSYLAGFTTSLWPSWTSELQKTVNPQTGVWPQDPVNRFVTCGRCSRGGTTCSIDSDCPLEGDTCASVDGYNALTCWNEQARAYRCPSDNGENSSHLYTYRSLDNGTRYELAAEFEVPPPNPSNPSQGWWSPPLFEEVRQCVTQESAGRACLTDADCRVCPLGICDGVAVMTGACQALGGRYRYANLCEGGEYGESSTCGDGVIDANPQHLMCLGGSSDGRSCSSNAQCPGGSCQPAEMCETTGVTATRETVCTTGDGLSGTKHQVCVGCRQYADDVNNPGCFAIRQCGNGRRDGNCNEDPTVGCSSTLGCRDRYVTELQQSLLALGYTVAVTNTYDDQTSIAVRAFQTDQGIQIDGIAGPETIGELKNELRSRGLGCADPALCFTSYAGYQCVNMEVCDDGAQNGTYGHCNLTCNGYGGFCGDGMMSLGEACDFGFSADPANGGYCSGSCTLANSCNLSCSDLGPRCGDGRVDAPPEQCDGAPLVTEKAICNDSITPCTTSADCPPARVCGLFPACSRSYVCGGTGPSAGAQCTHPGTAGPNCLDGSVCGTTLVQTYRTLNCEPQSSNRACQYESGGWSGCRAREYCGNGVVDAGEECDDGNEIETDACTTICRNNVCGDGHPYVGVEECDLGDENGTPCNTAEYGSTCTSCSTACKYQLTQGGFCGNGVIETGSAEQCDTAGDTQVYAFASNPGDYRSCRALGYDYALASYSATRDLVTCSPSCGFAGCAMCGTPPTGASASDPLFQGVIEGALYDTLFQQPVESARVTLFYRGLQVAVTTSDSRGFFRFSDLDRHDGCNQYKLIIDSYADNPRTTLFDESTRGGYMPVETPSFQPHESVEDEETTSGRFTAVAVNWGEDTRRVTRDETITGYVIPRFNLIPRLHENEYIVQYWWDPRPGDDDGGIQYMIDRYRNDPEGTTEYMFTRYYDLMVRLPYTYTPGTFGRCSLSYRPETFDNTRGDLCNTRENNDYSRPLTDECRSVDMDPNGTDIEDQYVLLESGMARCTNKIRATAGQTCERDGVSTGVPCTDNWDCDRRIFGGVNLGGRCVATPEESREGSIDVLSGAEGAYLFCYHPEYATEEERQSPDCRNFLIPPQSVFISGKGGQYDVIVSQFFNVLGGQDARIWNWLSVHNASIALYTVDGFYDQWNFMDGFNAYGQVAQPPEVPGSQFCPNGVVEEGLYEPGSEDEELFAGSYPIEASEGRKAWTYQISLANWYNQYWVPLSIDTTNRVVNAWDPSFQSPGTRPDAAGYHMAASRYFADTYVRRLRGVGDAGAASCWYLAFLDNLYGSDETLPNGTYVCNDNLGSYTGDVDDAPACDSTTQAMCAANFSGSACASTVNDSARCVQSCTPNASDCEGTVRGSSGAGTIPAFCGGVYTGSGSPAGGTRD